MVLTRLVAGRIVDDAPTAVSGTPGRRALSQILAEAARGLDRVTAVVAAAAVVAIAWSLIATGRRRHDLTVVGGVVLALVVIGVLGVSVGSLVVGTALGAIAVAVGSLLEARPLTSG